MADFLEEQVKLLRDYGVSHEIKTAASACAALSLLEKERFDLVILDLKMPTKNGIEILHEIKRRFPETKVIIYSAWIDEITVNELFKAGADEVLTKPCTPPERFLSAINALLDPAKESTVVVIQGLKVRSAVHQLLPRLVEKALTRCNRNVTATAKALGVTRRCLFGMLKRYGITR